MPCYQEQERRKRQAYIEQHRRDVDLYKGIADPVEVLKIMHAKQAYDPLIRYLPYPLNREQVYSALSGEDAERMKVYALELLGAGDEDQRGYSFVAALLQQRAAYGLYPCAYLP